MRNPAFDLGRRSLLLGSGLALAASAHPLAAFERVGRTEPDTFEQLILLFADRSSRSGAEQLQFFHGSAQTWLPSIGARFAAERGRLVKGEAALVACEWEQAKSAARTLYSAGLCTDREHRVHAASLVEFAPLSSARAVHEVFPSHWSAQQIDRRAQAYARRSNVRVMLSLESGVQVLA